MKTIVLSREDAEVYQGKGPHAVISISSPFRDHVLWPDADGSYMIALLTLSFNDVSEDQPDAMEEDHAKAIARFVRNWKNLTNMFICQCQGGRSRSAAVAIAIDEHFHGESAKSNDPRYVPNKHVYNLTKKALGEVKCTTRTK